MAIRDLSPWRLGRALSSARLILLGSALLALLSIPVSLAAPAPLSPDVRLVVDISGSMKQTDPENLRRPALELLARLVPETARAGVWTFGHQVNMLVPHQNVDSDWKARALGASQDINSVAMYTNIGQALERAGYDMEQESQGYQRHIILLTDGKVDVSPIAEINQNEQQRLLQQLVPALSEAGFRIHTIALSEQADHALLRQMAQGSDGIFSRAENADQLLASLLQILHQAVPADSLPLENNRFLVDDSVREFTALVMRSPGSPAAALESPAGEIYSYGDHPENINWHSTDVYDLITVQEPQAGQWRIDAELGPNSRVTVVSNLQLLVQPLPNNAPVNHPLTLEFSLTEEQQTIADSEFLNLVTAEIEIVGPKGSPKRRVSWNKAPPVDGIYKLGLTPLPAPGNYQLSLLVDGKTFQRGFSHQLSVSSLFAVELEKTIAEEQVHYQILVSADPDAVDPAATNVVAHIKNSTGYTAVRNLERSGADWSLQIAPEEPAHYSVDLEVSGKRYDGAGVRETLATQYFRFPEPGDPYTAPEDQAVAELEAELAGSPELEEEGTPKAPETPPEIVLPEASEPQVEPEPPAEVVAAEQDSRFWLYTALVVANLLVVALIVFGYRMISSSRAASREESETESQEQEETQENVQVGAPPPMQDIDTDLDDSEAEAVSTANPEEHIEPESQLNEEQEEENHQPPEPEKLYEDEESIDLETLDAWEEAEEEKEQNVNSDGEAEPDEDSKPNKD